MVDFVEDDRVWMAAECMGQGIEIDLFEYHTIYQKKN